MTKHVIKSSLDSLESDFEIFVCSKLVQHSSAFVMEGVKNLVVKKHNLPVTKIVDELMEVCSYPETDY